MYNKIIIVGNLTRDVELKYLSNGTAVARIGLASNRKYKKQDGSMADETCFIDADLWGRTAEIANQYLKKGSQVLIDGRLRMETWVDKDGKNRSKHSITAESLQMLGKKGDNLESSTEYSSYNAQNSSKIEVQNASEPKVPEIKIDEEEIPF